MANTYLITPGSGDTVAGVELGGAFTAYASTGKLPGGVLYVGPSAASAPAPVSNANPLPISDAGGSITVDGTVAVTGTFWQATQPVSGPLTDAQLRAAAVPVSGDFYQATQPVSAESLPLPAGAATEATLAAVASALGGTLDVAGPLTDAELRASAVPVSLASVPSHAVTNAGTFAVQASQVGTWTVTGAGGTFPVTDSGGSITVDAPVGTPVFVRLSDGTDPLGSASNPLRTNPTGTTTQPVSDAGGSLTVDTGQLPAALVGGRLDVAVGTALPAGTNNIGDVDVLTQPARSRTVDAVSVAQQTDALMSGLTALTPKFAAIQASSSGDNTIVAAVPTKKIRVLKLALSASAAVNAKLRSATAGDITGLFYLAANGGFGLSYCPVGNCETTAGEALVLNLSGTIPTGGVLTYIEV